MRQPRCVGAGFDSDGTEFELPDRLDKARGLLGRDHLDGALVIPGRRSVHSFSMGFELDVAFLDGDGTVIRALRLRRNRVTLPVWQSRCVVEAEAGAFGEWELKVGDLLEIRLANGDGGSVLGEPDRPAGS